MTKSKTAAKRKRVGVGDTSHKLLKSSVAITPPPDGSAILGPQDLHALVSEEELDITVDTLNLLSKHPNLIKMKACKDLRVAIYNFKQASTSGMSTAVHQNLTGRITAALADGLYMTAMIMLSEMRVRKETPKLGALCRWVRDLDVVSGLSMQQEGVSRVVSERSKGDKERLSVLDLILRVTGPVDINTHSSGVSSAPIALQETWHPGREFASGPTALQSGNTDLNHRYFNGTLVSGHAKDLAEKLRVVETTPGSKRKPPNHHPAVLYTSQDDTISLSSIDLRTMKHDHPVVPNLALITDVLSTAECKQVIALGEAVGFLPDAPLRDGEDVSILAHNFYWVVDQSFHDKIWQRVKSHVPTKVDGQQARGLNRRFRVYRYVPGAEYRCHIDGAWPPSGICPTTGKYLYDSSPPDAPQSSLYTFLIYLNDDFEAGETTFFVPSAREGVMNAYPIRPIMGAVAMFPHGEARGALLHEGTGVRKGAKYIIRTDVLYDIKASGK